MKKRGAAAALGLVTFLALFWDWLPTVWLHAHYCEKYGGLTIHKTPEQWKQENPDAMKTLGVQSSSRQVGTNGNYYYDLNPRVRWETSNEATRFWLRKSETRLTDSKTNQVIASLIDFSTGQASGRLEGARAFRDIKFWMYRNSCEQDGHMVGRKEFNSLSSAFQNLGRQE
jgi:hypothetical protein